MTPAEMQRLARRQLTDYDARSPGGMFANGVGSLTVEDAYRIQIEVARLRRLRGEAIAGYKIGCVSQSIRRQLGVTHAVFGHMFEGEMRPDGAVLANKDFDHLGIEGEFAVRLAKDVSDPEALRDAPERYVSHVFPVIELHNYVFRGGKPSGVELIANNAVHAGAVVCETQVGAEDHQALEVSVSINDELQGAARLDPFASLHELAQRLSAFGISLRQGEIVLTGSPLPLYRVNAGDRIKARCPEVGEVAASVGP